MFKKITKYYFVIIFLPIFVFLMSGCGNTSQDSESVQTKNEIKETNSLITPQYELVETPKYQSLKKQVDKARNEVNRFESERNILLVKYTEEYNPVKKATTNLEESRKKLRQLEDLLDEEFNKLESRPKNTSV